MGKPRLLCDCSKIFKLKEKVGRFSGHQRSREYIGSFHLYECDCGNKYWEFIKG